MQRAAYHVHDGFYLRLGAGLGGGHASISADKGNGKNFGMGGGGAALNLWVGGTPWRGIALGGMGSYQGLSDSDTVLEGQKTGLGTNGSTFLVGPFIDAFPDPLRGLHVGGSLSLAFLNVKSDSHALQNAGFANYNAGGLGGSAWIGYMGWVAPEWSLGGMLQLSGYTTRKKEDNGLDRSGSGWDLSLSFTALFH
jgi:hypothetical protein